MIGTRTLSEQEYLRSQNIPIRTYSLSYKRDNQDITPPSPMSTVALKGKLELIETIETKNPSPEQVNSTTSTSKENKDCPGATTAGDKTTTSTRKVRKWHWKGRWAFGSHIDETFSHNHNITTPLLKNAHKLQPFHYSFEEVADPTTVAVPSLAILASLSTNHDTIEKEFEEFEDESLPGEVKIRSMHSTKERTNSTLEQVEPLSSRSTCQEDTEERAQHLRNPPMSSSVVVEIKADSTKPQNLRNSFRNDQSRIPEETGISPQNILHRSSQDQPNTQEEADVKTELRTCTNKQQGEPPTHDDESGRKLEKFTDKGAVMNVASTDTKNLNAGGAYNENDNPTPKVDHAFPKTLKQLDPALSFAAVSAGDPPFADACTFLRQKHDCNADDEIGTSLGKPYIGDCRNPCPQSGLWKGFFQNATVGRGKGTQRVHEEFYLFLNACPGESALFSFDVVQDQMPPPHVRDPILVRGSGENQFGTFEICGYLDIGTMEMEIQRQYVHVEEETRTRIPSTNRKKKQRSSTSVVTRHKSSRPYFTRKRQPSWKVKSQEENFEDEMHKRKKRKMNVEIAFNDSEGYSNGLTAPTSVASAVSVESGPDSVLLSSDSHVNNVETARTPIKRKTSNLVSSARKRGSTTGTIKASPKHNHLAVISHAVAMKLPPTGDTQKSKWRAAHFLYYQRHDPEEPSQQQNQQPQQMWKQANPRGPPGSSSTSTISTNPKYVIYEGEMADSRREGRGICLYSNNMLYEGEWKRNKEHGYGRVMTSDRTRIIYEGEFERGRMQGRGTYYYDEGESFKFTEAGARYIGEFKENMRHGIGKYYLPDKSFYEGVWSNGLMNGRGVFTWADNSFYDGEWKDGKRYVHGVL